MEINRRQRMANFIKNCMRCAVRNDFLQLDELLKTKLARDIPEEAGIEESGDIFEGLREYANEQVDRYRMEFIEDLTDKAREADLEITIDFPRFESLKGIEGEIDFSNRTTTINLRDDRLHTQHQSSSSWIRTWLAKNRFIIGLNAAQNRAMELPFAYQLSLIDGPPGTGKTHLLGWILIALVLHPTPENAGSRLLPKGETSHNEIDRLIDPDRPATLAIMDHRRHRQECEPEADIISRIACRMITHFAIQPEQIALISPHRAQNNAISARLSDLLEGTNHELPLIDTVERIQGAEGDVIIFGFTVSDRDHVMSRFLNNPNRFNVVITRARKKLIVIGSKSFFSAIPNREKALGNNVCFKEFYEHCKKGGSLFFL